MDPNEALKEIRLIVDSADNPEDMPRLKELFRSLDHWLCNRGFPPGDWIKVKDLRKRKDKL